MIRPLRFRLRDSLTQLRSRPQSAAPRTLNPRGRYDHRTVSSSDIGAALTGNGPMPRAHEGAKDVFTSTLHTVQSLHQHASETRASSCNALLCSFNSLAIYAQIRIEAVGRSYRRIRQDEAVQAAGRP